MLYRFVFLGFALICLTSGMTAQQVIWTEPFDVFEKGWWGDGSGNVTGDMAGISKWTIDVTACNLADASDYIKTVSTSGGRLQAVDINGEAIWMSELIDISGKQNVSVSLSVSETGTSNVIDKYVKLFYKIDGGSEIYFETNGQNIGNFGSFTSAQGNLNGNSLQLVARFSNPNASDACIIDNVSVSFDNSKPIVLMVVPTSQSGLRIKFSEPVNEEFAENISNYAVNPFGNPQTAILSFDNLTIDLVFQSDFIPETLYSITISGIPDLNGNYMDQTELVFRYRNFKLDECKVLSQNELQLIFTHFLDSTLAETESNYFVDNSIGNPTSAELLNDTMVKLTFGLNFVDDVQNQLSINNITDAYGLALGTVNQYFIFHVPKPFDVVFNELMVDVNPSPTIVPAAKFIELFNRSGFDLDLTGWKLQVENNIPVTFPPFELKQGEFLILCSSSDSAKFSPFGNVLPVLPASQLTSSGKQLILSCSDDVLIDYIKYSDAWYGNPEKAEGGWSLERIDTENFCGTKQNWSATLDYKGGTPAKINSLVRSNPDLTVPLLEKMQVPSSNTIILNFSKNLKTQSALNIDNFLLNDGLNHISYMQFPDSSRSCLVLKFANNFSDGETNRLFIKNLEDYCGNLIDDTILQFIYHRIYPVAVFAESDRILHLVFSEEVDIVSAQHVDNYLVNKGIGIPSYSIKHNERLNEVYLEFLTSFANGEDYSIHLEDIQDINGNRIQPAELSFIYFRPSFNQLVINEILFNPTPSGYDYVEIYNKSGYPVDLSKISLASKDDRGNIISKKPLANGNLLYQSGHFLAITSDSIKVKNEYPATAYDLFIQLHSMPSFNDDQGVVVLLSNDSIIDEFNYSEDMHFDLLTNKEGISLERIDPDKPTQIETNWNSASENKGYGTPANQNSQFYKLSNDMSEGMDIEPETFSPDNDGYNDLVFIRYKFVDPGYVGNISIYDAKGKLIKKLASNVLLAAEGEFSWDGLTQNNTRAVIGIYLVYFEVFNLQGVVKKYKKVCVLAERLN